MSMASAILAGLVMTGACASLGRSYLAACKARDYSVAFWLKGGAALCFLALGLLGAARCPLPAFAWKVAAGLFLGLVGDELLALRFLKPEKFDLFFGSGALAFALGHGLYIWALLGRVPGALLPALGIAAVLFAASVFYLKRKEYDAGPFSASGMGYILLVALMGSVALASALAAPGWGTALFALGGLCFLVSDDALCVYCFGSDRRFGLNVLVHVCYYAAQLLIAWSLFLIG